VKPRRGANIECGRRRKARFATSGHTTNHSAVSDRETKTRRHDGLFERRRPRTARLRSEVAGTKKTGGDADHSVSREEDTTTKTQFIRAAAHIRREQRKTRNANPSNSAATHEEKSNEREIAAKDLALAVAARLLRREASGAATLAQYHPNSNWAGPLCVRENQSRKPLRENSSAIRERIKSALGQIRNQKSQRKMESPDLK
jgi:hypothetical protein